MRFPRQSVIDRALAGGEQSAAARGFTARNWTRGYGHARGSSDASTKSGNLPLMQHHDRSTAEKSILVSFSAITKGVQDSGCRCRHLRSGFEKLNRPYPWTHRPNKIRLDISAVRGRFITDLAVANQGKREHSAVACGAVLQKSTALP